MNIKCRSNTVRTALKQYDFMKNRHFVKIGGMALALLAAIPSFGQEIVVVLSPTCDITLTSDNPDKAFPGEKAMEMYTVRQQAKYASPHPCAMYSAADFKRVKTSLDNGTAPDAVKQEFEALKKNSYSSLTRSASPQELIVRGDPTGTGLEKENYVYAMRDAAAAYQTALLWKLTDDEAYAKKSIEIMNAWAAKCKKITSNDSNQMLAAGCQGYTFACAAEIMLTYDGWTKADVAAYKQWMLDVFATKNLSFLKHEAANVCDLHYWSNWDLVNMASYLAIGILTEDCDMVDYVVSYFYDGVGNGCVKNLIQGTFDDPLGSGEQICQAQECGRDQGHALMSAVVLGNLAQMAYSFYTVNPSESKLDFFSTNDNALLKLGEYVALCNLRDGTDSGNKEGNWIVDTDKVPFNTYLYCKDCSCQNKSHGATQTKVANDSGRGGARPGWEIFFNHYAKIKELSSGFKYVKQMADKMRPECGPGDSRYGNNSGAFDQLGWATLMMFR